MRFLADQDVYHMTLAFLKSERHDILAAQELGMHRAPDEELLRRAKQGRRLLLTRDKGFGALTFLRSEDSAGVILLRGNPGEIDRVHQELLRLLNDHTEDELTKLFCVVEPHRHRLRRLPGK